MNRRRSLFVIEELDKFQIHQTSTCPRRLARRFQNHPMITKSLQRGTLQRRAIGKQTTVIGLLRWTPRFQQLFLLIIRCRLPLVFPPSLWTPHLGQNRFERVQWNQNKSIDSYRQTMLGSIVALILDCVCFLFLFRSWSFGGEYAQYSALRCCFYYSMAPINGLIQLDAALSCRR